MKCKRWTREKEIEKRVKSNSVLYLIHPHPHSALLFTRITNTRLTHILIFRFPCTRNTIHHSRFTVNTQFCRIVGHKRGAEKKRRKEKKRVWILYRMKRGKGKEKFQHFTRVFPEKTRACIPFHSNMFILLNKRKRGKGETRKRSVEIWILSWRYKKVKHMEIHFINTHNTTQHNRQTKQNRKRDGQTDNFIIYNKREKDELFFTFFMFQLHFTFHKIHLLLSQSKRYYQVCSVLWCIHLISLPPLPFPSLHFSSPRH